MGMVQMGIVKLAKVLTIKKEGKNKNHSTKLM
jgi:hypothetical protein